MTEKNIHAIEEQLELLAEQIDWIAELRNESKYLTNWEDFWELRLGRLIYFSNKIQLFIDDTTKEFEVQHNEQQN